jgi:hypothetical protein
MHAHARGASRWRRGVSASRNRLHVNTTMVHVYHGNEESHPLTSNTTTMESSSMYTCPTTNKRQTENTNVHNSITGCSSLPWNVQLYVTRLRTRVRSTCVRTPQTCTSLSFGFRLFVRTYVRTYIHTVMLLCHNFLIGKERARLCNENDVSFVTTFCTRPPCD